MTGVALMFTSCVNQFNQIYKSSDNDLKYEYAKECYLRGKYVKATTDKILYFPIDSGSSGTCYDTEGYRQCGREPLYACNGGVQEQGL